MDIYIDLLGLMLKYDTFPIHYINLMKYNDMKPYFYDKCLHVSKAKNLEVMVVKTEHVVVPGKQWKEFHEFKEKHEWKYESNTVISVAAAPANS